MEDEVERRLVNLKRAAHALENIWEPPAALDIVSLFLSNLVNEGRPDHEIAPVDPRLSDQLVSELKIVHDSTASRPWLRRWMPESPVQQCWTATSGHLDQVRVPLPPSSSLMVEIEDVNADALTRRPIGAGLYTTSTVSGQEDMWRKFLGWNVSNNSDTSLWRQPWRTWALQARPDARILTIESAADWAAAVSAHPLWGQDGELYLNHAQLAQKFDGLHVTLPAVCAIDGMRFTCTNGVTAPWYFSCECTFWFRWVFDAPLLVV